MAVHVQWIVGIKEKVAKKPDSTDALLLLKSVADGSPAAELGLRAGDYLVQLNGKTPLGIDLESTWSEHAVKEIAYRFYSNFRKAYIDATLINVPLGATLEASSAAIVTMVRDFGIYDNSAYTELWRRGDWDALYQVAFMGPKHARTWQRVMRSFKKHYASGLAALFLGAALYERGQQEEGIRLVMQFVENDLRKYTADSHAIAYYYAAMWAKSHDDASAYAHWLAQSNRSNGGEFQRITDEVEDWGEEAPSASNVWLQQRFPVDYSLARFDSDDSSPVSLQATLDAMADDQLLPLCVMPAYRGNGPYNDVMRCYRTMYPHLEGRILPLQVLTDVQQKPAGRDHWFEQEKAALAEGIPIDFLYDAGAEVAAALALTATPACFLLDKQGMVVCEGDLCDSQDYWAALGPEQTILG